MRIRTCFEFLGVGLLAVGLSAYAAMASDHEVRVNHTAEQTCAPGQSDPISGAWDVSFFVKGTAHPSTFDLKLEGTTITGTAFSDHTGPGTVRNGVWADGKLSFTLDFKKHESIAIKGALKDGKLAGEFTTEGFTAKWEAQRK